MGIVHAQAPEGGEAAVAATLEELAIHKEAVPEARLEMADIADAAATAPHPVYFLAKSSIGEPIGEAAVMTGWRHFVVSGEKAIAAVTVSHEGEGGPAVTDINLGRLVQPAIDAVAAAEASHGGADAVYELRYIEAPAVYFAAKWLHSDDAEDVFFPLEDHPDAGVKAGQPLSEGEVQELLGARKGMEGALPEEDDDK